MVTVIHRAAPVSASAVAAAWSTAAWSRRRHLGPASLAARASIAAAPAAMRPCRAVASRVALALLCAQMTQVALG
jgi:hypothetical protein